MHKLQALFVTFLLIVTAMAWIPTPSMKKKRREVEPVPSYKQRRAPEPVPSYKQRRAPEPVPSYKQRRAPEPVPSYRHRRASEPVPSYRQRRAPEPVPSYRQRRAPEPVPSYKQRRAPEPVPSYMQRRAPEPVPSYKQRREVQQEVFVDEDGTVNYCTAGSTSCPISPLDTRHECVDLKDDMENCGACGNICGKGKGERTSSCTDGVCVITSCRTGYALNDGICERN